MLADWLTGNRLVYTKHVDIRTGPNLETSYFSNLGNQQNVLAITKLLSEFQSLLYIYLL